MDPDLKADPRSTSRRLIVRGLKLLILFTVLNLLITGIIPKWAIFAPVFVPLMMRLHVPPEATLAAYRVGDSPTNAIQDPMATEGRML